jgi:hypothetical protein
METLKKSQELKGRSEKIITVWGKYSSRAGTCPEHLPNEERRSERLNRYQAIQTFKRLFFHKTIPLKYLHSRSTRLVIVFFVVVVVLDKKIFFNFA